VAEGGGTVISAERDDEVATRVQEGYIAADRIVEV